MKAIFCCQCGTENNPDIRIGCWRCGHVFCPRCSPPSAREYGGTEGQDRENYTDIQDRANYTMDGEWTVIDG